MTLYVIIGAFTLLVYLLGRAAFAVAKQAGRDEAIKEVTEKAATLDHERAKEMLKEKTVAQVIQDLASGNF